MMIPLPFVLSGVALFLIFQEFNAPLTGRRNRTLLAFIAVFVVQTLLVGFRFGYGQDWVLRLQPMIAPLLASLGALAFFAPKVRQNWWLHPIAVLIAFGILWLWPVGVDAYLTALNFGAAGVLFYLAIGGENTLAWVELNRVPRVRFAIFALAATLAFTGLADGAVVIDYWLNAGANTANIIAIVSLGFLALMGGVLVFRRSVPLKPAILTPDVVATFDKVQSFLSAPDVYGDMDLNLNRIARRLVLPAREVSTAINQKTGNNLSQFVNGIRINAACDLLRQTQKSITEIQFEVGFSTKSNFHREFQRVTGMTPTKWRGAK